MARMIAVTSATGNIGLLLVRMLQSAKQPFRVLARDPLPAKCSDLTSRSRMRRAPTRSPARRRRSSSGVPVPSSARRQARLQPPRRQRASRTSSRSSSGTIDIDPPTVLGNWRRELEHALSASGVACTFLRPGNFASNALRWAPTIRAKSTVFAPKPDSASIPVDPHDIAAVAFASLVTDGHAGKIYSVQGPTVMTARTQAAIIADESGGRSASSRCRPSRHSPG